MAGDVFLTLLTRDVLVSVRKTPEPCPLVVYTSVLYFGKRRTRTKTTYLNTDDNTNSTKQNTQTTTDTKKQQKGGIQGVPVVSACTFYN